MIDFTKDISQRTNEADKRYTYELFEFKEFNTFVPTLEDEVIGLEFLLAEPGSSDGLVEPFLGVNSANLQRCFGAEDQQNHKNISKNGTKYSFHTSRRGERYQWEDNNGHVRGTDEGILQEMNNLPSICEDYLFDCKLAGEVSMLDYDSSNMPFINQPSEFKSENGKECNGYKGNYCKGSEKMVDESMTIYADLTTEVGRLCQSSASSLSEKVVPEVISLGQEELFCDSIVTFSSVVGDGGLHLMKNDACFMQKRLRKRPLRYMDEYSKYHSIHTNNKRSASPSRSTREKTAHTTYLDYVKDVNKRKSVQYNEYIKEPIQVPFGPSVLKERSKKKAFSSRDHDPEVYSNAIVKFSEGSTNTERSFNPSQDDISDSCYLEEVTKDKSGRKHNRYWSDYEIAKLIEGVATFGVGRWTEIKRGLFPPTTRRTSVDLKDKWRNLLKACRAHLHSTHKGSRVAHQQVSQSVLWQVNELAAMHPYPKIPSRKNAHLVKC